MVILLFVGGSAMLSFLAWHGGKVAVVMLFASSVAVVVLNRIVTALLDDVLRTSHETLKNWTLESAYAATVTTNYTQMLRLLYEHDPSAAEIFQDRLGAALSNRHPDVALAAAERAASAEMN